MGPGALSGRHRQGRQPRAGGRALPGLALLSPGRRDLPGCVGRTGGAGSAGTHGRSAGDPRGRTGVAPVGAGERGANRPRAPAAGRGPDADSRRAGIADGAAPAAPAAGQPGHPRRPGGRPAGRRARGHCRILPPQGVSRGRGGGAGGPFARTGLHGAAGGNLEDLPALRRDPARTAADRHAALPGLRAGNRGEPAAVNRWSVRAVGWSKRSRTRTRATRTPALRSPPCRARHGCHRSGRRRAARPPLRRTCP